MSDFFYSSIALFHSHKLSLLTAALGIAAEILFALSLWAKRLKRKARAKGSAHPSTSLRIKIKNPHF